MTLPMTSVTQGTPPVLADQALALGVYLESLLCVAPPVLTPPAAPPITEAAAPADATPFQVLLFRIAGLTLAAPLAELNGVLPWPECITPLPGHSPFFLGLATHLGRHVKIIDTARLLAPQQQRPQRRAETGLRHVVLMGGGEWGMACEGISGVLTLAPGAVRWRATRTQRPWMAGMVTQHLCALLDTRAFAAELQKGMPAQG